MRVVFWGTYDPEQPRIKILKEGAQKNNIEIIECNKDIWQKIPDKSFVNGFFQKIFLLINWFIAYPQLIYRYLRLAKHEFLILSYPGLFDIFFIWLFARIKGVKILWDAYIPLYDCVVNDRKTVTAGSLSAKILYLMEFATARLVDGYFLDTKTNAEHFESLYKLKPGSAGIIPVGAEDIFFNCRQKTPCCKGFETLFWGKFIPLQGVDTIVKAAHLIQNKKHDIEFTIVGTGQESEQIDRLIHKLGLKNITRIKWADYKELTDLICCADVCLGIFGATEKAQRVIPNKLYQALGAGKAIITGDTPAISELKEYGDFNNIHIIKINDPCALAEKIIELTDNQPGIFYEEIKFNADFIGSRFKQLLEASRAH